MEPTVGTKKEITEIILEVLKEQGSVLSDEIESRVIGKLTAKVTDQIINQLTSGFLHQTTVKIEAAMAKLDQAIKDLPKPSESNKMDAMAQKVIEKKEPVSYKR